MSRRPNFRILITGASGFVGSHLIKALRMRHGDNVGLLLTSKAEGIGATSVGCIALDVTSGENVAETIADFRPSHVVHLAGIAAPGIASSDPAMTWDVHLNGTLNIAGAILKHAPDCALINVGSGLAYGATARTGQPIDEDAVLAPTSTYEVTKAAADLAVGALVSKGLRCIRMRPFNHSGAGQSPDFVVPSFATQVAAIEAGQQDAVIRVGNLDAVRDFLHVSDVTTAYVLAMERAHAIPPGTILNIASGVPTTIQDILDRLLSLSSMQIRVEQDPARMRPSDTPYFVGNADRARAMLGWLPVCTIDQMLIDVLDDCRDRAGAR